METAVAYYKDELEVATVKVLQPFMPQLNGLLLN